MLRKLKQRDAKENEIAGYENSIGSCEFTKQKMVAQYEQKLERYQKWKKDNEIEGIRY